MDHNLEDSLTLEGMDFDHSEDVVIQEDIQLEDQSRLNSITMDMDSAEEQSRALHETVNDEDLVSDLIEDPFPFQEFSIQNPAASHNIMIDPHQMNQQTIQEDTGVTVKYSDTLIRAPGSAKSNIIPVKIAQAKTTKRVVASAPLRQVAIAPKPVQSKPIQYAIAPKPVALVTNKQGVGTIKKIPISAGNVKGNTVLAQLGRQLVMVPKKIKLMSSTSAEGIISSSSSGLQYQVACTPDQAQLIGSKGSKPMLKFIQLPGQTSTDKNTNSSVFTKVMTPNAPKTRYVMQQKTVPITIGGNTVIQNVKIGDKNKIIAIKATSPKVQTTTGNVATKKVVISSNANRNVLVRSNASTPTTQVVKAASNTGQRTQFHPINVPGKGIQYIKLVTNEQPPKPGPKLAVPSKNFVFTDSKGNVIQMTAEKVVSGQSIITTKGVVKPLKSQKRFVRIAPVSKAVTHTISQPVRSSQSLLAPITTTTGSVTTKTMTSQPTISSSVASSHIAETSVTLEEFNDMVEQDSDKTTQQSYSLSNYMDSSRYSDTHEFSTAEHDFSTATDDYSTAEETSQLHDELHEDSVDPDETIDIKPTLQSLISDAVGEDREFETEMEHMQEVEIEYEKKQEPIRNASFMLQDDSHIEHDTSHTSGIHDESIIIVPGSNYTERAQESMYSDESQSYRRRRHSSEHHKPVPYLSVEAECVPYSEDMVPESPQPLSEPDTASNLDLRPRKACNCTKSQCLKLYCDCFANGEFCNNCNCNNCHNNLENEEVRQKAIRSCLERNPNAFRPKIGKSKTGGPEIIRRHTKGCNCKRSGCLKNYCECYEAKIACTAMCKCVGCRNVEETLVRRRDAIRLREKLSSEKFRPAPATGPVKQPCSLMTTEVIEAVCQCLVAAAGEGPRRDTPDPVADVIDEFARCLQDVITASHHTL